jgi:glycosyltransferase involved in cell wall biosynthesis
MTQTKVPASVVILAKNEASRIRDCIQSVSWAAEVLVVDDESVDETVAMATSLGARVLRRTMDIEGRHRNWAYAQATHEWVLSLDADERVTPELETQIRQLLHGQPPHNGYAIPRRNYLGTHWIRYGGWYPSAQMKLFRKSAFKWEEAEVHPKAHLDGSWAALTADLVHFSYNGVSDFIQKLDRQTSLEAKKWVRDGRRVTLGKSLWRTTDRFLRSFIFKQGYRDGFWGLLVAVLGGFYQLVTYAKYRELSAAKSRA